MTKLHELAQRLPDKSVMTSEELNLVKGGKRYRTTSFANFTYVKTLLQSHGYNTTSMVHGNEYCIEW